MPTTMKGFCVLALFMTLAAPAPVWARGGGGCVEEGTLVLTPGGPVPVERLQPGDQVLSWLRDGLHPASVQTLTVTRPERIIQFVVGGVVVRATEEHPFATAPGEFREAGRLREGDILRTWDGGELKSRVIQSASSTVAQRPAYNLSVFPGGTFISGNILVHNKGGGCFLPGTPILRSDGTETPIEEIRPGDEVLAFTSRGETVRTAVEDVLIHEVDEYFAVSTEQVILRVTPEHPFFVGEGTYRTVEALRLNDSIFVFDGKGLRRERITGLERNREHSLVYNLRTDRPHTFFAGGAAVHNKGGGGGGGYHSSSSGRSSSSRGGNATRGDAGSSSEESMIAWLFGSFAAVIFAPFAFLVFLALRGGKKLDHIIGRSRIAARAKIVLKSLESISRYDMSMMPETLRQVTESTFRQLQSCWEARSYSPMEPLLMPDLYAQHCAQIQGLVRNHEVNLIADLSVESVDIVHLRYTNDPDQREFTALITAAARDYYQDDRTGKFLRGDKKPERFQEFWTFQLQKGSWLLREIEQTGESDALKDPIFCEVTVEPQFEDGTGAAGMQKSGGGSRIDRLLDSLEKNDRLWRREYMKSRVRTVFTNVFTAREAGDPAALRPEGLYPEVAAYLREDISKNRRNGIAVEYRNFCIRKVGFALVRNYPDSTRDEFTARISAHAQKVVRRNGEEIKTDEYVVPFEECWTFGRLDGDWRLKEMG